MILTIALWVIVVAWVACQVWEIRNGSEHVAMYWVDAAYIVMALLSAGRAIAERNYGTAGIWLFYAGVVGWTWWMRNKRRRKRQADRMAGVVKDIGHRLVVVNPVPVTETGR